MLPEIAPLKVPPQPLVIPGVLATCSPPVSVSLKATPFSATVSTDGLVSVKVRVVVPPGRIVAARNALLMVGGATTARPAEAVEPVPPCVEVMTPVVLFLAPAVVPVTSTPKLSVPFAARLAPDNVITLVPCVAVSVPPPTVPVRFLGVEITRPAGSVSLKPIPLSAVVVLVFWMVKVRWVFPFSGMLLTKNALAIVVGATTVMEAFEVFPVPAVVELTVTLLFFTPAVVPVTFTMIVQEVVVASVAPDKLTTDEPGTAVGAVLQVLLSPLGVATTIPAGNVSVNATPVSATLAFGFEMLKVRVVDPFTGMLGAPNILRMLGGEATASDAVAVFPVPPLVEETVTLLFLYTPGCTGHIHHHRAVRAGRDTA